MYKILTECSQVRGHQLSLLYTITLEKSVCVCITFLSEIMIRRGSNECAVGNTFYRLYEYENANTLPCARFITKFSNNVTYVARVFVTLSSKVVYNCFQSVSIILRLAASRGTSAHLLETALHLFQNVRRIAHH